MFEFPGAGEDDIELRLDQCSGMPRPPAIVALAAIPTTVVVTSAGRGGTLIVAPGPGDTTAVHRVRERVLEPVAAAVPTLPADAQVPRTAPSAGPRSAPECAAIARSGLLLVQ